MREPIAVALILAGLSAGCGDRPPPCHPEGESGGTVAGPTQTPPWGPGGPGDPPDPGDAPDTYSKNAAGQVCLCSPYQSGCTTNPSGTSGSEGSASGSPSPSSSSVPSAPKSCVKACNAGYARFSQYCQNPDWVEGPIRKKCAQFADDALTACLGQTPDKGCEVPCENIRLTFERFCRVYATNKEPCWRNSTEAHAACMAKG
jgi:hypothetical protein